MYLPMTTKVQKWGNSFAVRLSMDFVRRFGLRAGSIVEKRETEDAVIIRPVKRQKQKETLDSMLARITPEMIHPATDWGETVGKEIW